MKNYQKGFAPIIILIIIGVVVGGGVYYSKKKNVEKMKIEEKTEIRTETKTNKETTLNVVTELTENKGVLKGYYTQTLREAWGDEKVCDTFVTVDGHKELISYFKDMVERGNSVNSLDAQGNLVINLNLKEISANDRSIITGSTKTQPVTLNVQKLRQDARGAAVCHSFFKVLGISAKQ